MKRRLVVLVQEVRRCPVLNQELYDVAMAVKGRDMERGAVVVVDDVDVGAPRDEDFGRRHHSRVGHQVERGLTFGLADGLQRRLFLDQGLQCTYNSMSKWHCNLSIASPNRSDLSNRVVDNTQGSHTHTPVHRLASWVGREGESNCRGRGGDESGTTSMQWPGETSIFAACAWTSVFGCAVHASSSCSSSFLRSSFSLVWHPFTPIPRICQTSRNRKLRK